MLNIRSLSVDSSSSMNLESSMYSNLIRSTYVGMYVCMYIRARYNTWSLDVPLSPLFLPVLEIEIERQITFLPN
jgi:hypothetical protein